MSDIEIILPGELLSLDPRTSGFAHGFGLFETIRVRAGCIELWEMHWQRLKGSAEELGLACPFGGSAVLDAVRILAQNLPADALVKLSLLKGAESDRLLVYSRPLVPLPDNFGLLMDAPGRIDEASALAGHKTHNYIENIMVSEASRSMGCYDGLRLNTQGHVAEGAMSNIFFHRKGRMHTPGIDCGLLPGVIRESLVKLLSVEEGSYTAADLLSADAIFLTNSSIGLQPVDWLLFGGKKIRIESRDHSCYGPAQDLLADHIEDSAIKL